MFVVDKAILFKVHLVAILVSITVWILDIIIIYTRKPEKSVYLPQGCIIVSQFISQKKVNNLNLDLYQNVLYNNAKKYYKYMMFWIQIYLIQVDYQG